MRRVAIALVTTVLALVAIEAGARLALERMGPPEVPLVVGFGETDQGDPLRDVLYRHDDELFFRLRPNLDLERTASPNIFDVRTNSLGLRGGEVAMPKPAGRLRVLCVGDSCTFGSGAGTGESYPARLEVVLASSASGSVEVVNAGVPGFSSYQGRRYLELEGLDLDPDIVLFAAGINDSMPAQPGSKRQFQGVDQLSDRQYAEVRVRKEKRWGVQRLADRIGRKAPREAVDPSSTEGAETTRVSLEEYRDNLIAVVAACRSRNIHAVVVAWPTRRMALGLPMVGRGIAMARYREAARQVCESHDVTFIDLVPAMDGYADKFIDDVHLNPAGYRRVARVLGKALAPLLDEE